MRIRTWVGVFGMLLLHAAAHAGGGGPTESQSASFYQSFDGWQVLQVVRDVGLVALASFALFKLFSSWPRAERWLVAAALVALPLLATFAFNMWVPMGGSSYVRDTFMFWSLVVGVFAVLWWLVKTKTRWLGAPLATEAPATAKVPPEVAPAPALAREPPVRAPEPATPAASESIFISYRRQDSADATGRIYDRLVQRFDRKQVFKDVDSIPLGVDFRTHLDNVVGRCRMLLVVIGPSWLASTGPNGRRLDDDDDFVRIEIEAALARDIPVIPVLVGGASLPAKGELPPSLGPLTYRNGILVRPDPDFHRDMDRLIAGLDLP